MPVWKVASVSWLHDEGELWRGPHDRRFRKNVFVRGQGCARRVPDLELLQERREEDEELLLGQRLPEADALADAEGNYSIDAGKISV